jgi:hypothetical protein
MLKLGDEVEDVEGDEVEVVEGEEHVEEEHVEEEHVEEEHVEGDSLQNQEASTLAVEVAQTMPPAQASTSAVNVVPLDASNPEATINAPQAVRRYLTRWPQGEKDPHPVFNNVDCQDF